MSAPIVKSLWYMTGAQYLDVDPDCDVMAVTVTGHGHEYVVCVSGHKDLKVPEIINALRAAAGGLLRAAGGDMSVVGCESADDDTTFDTGDQRAS